MKQRTSSLPVVVVIAVIALVLGSIGTAVAAPALTKSKVKAIATKVVKKQAPTLAVASATNATSATNLAGKPASAYTDNVYLFRLPALATATGRIYTLGGLPAGNYSFSYSVVASVPANGRLTCYVRAVPPSSIAEGLSYGDSQGGSGGFSTAHGTGTIAVGSVAPTLECFGTGNFVMNPDNASISNVSFTALDTVQTATATGAKGDAGSRGGSVN